MRSPTFVAAFALLAFTIASGQKKPLDHSVYDSWNSIRSTSLSHDGHWIVYVIAPQEGDSKVEVKSLVTDRIYRLDRGSAVQFSNDSKYLIATIVPPLAETKKATKDKVPAADQPKNSLVILNLESGDQTRIDRVKSFQLAAEDSGWLIYSPEPPKADASKSPAAPEPVATKPTTPTRRNGAAGTSRSSGDVAAPKTGSPLVVRDLRTGKEERIENVSDNVVSKDGSTIAYTVTSKDEKEDGLYWLNLPQHDRFAVFKGKAKYVKLALADESKKLAVLTDKSADESGKPAKGKKAAAPKSSKSGFSVSVFDPKTKLSIWVATDSSTGLHKGWVISENGPLTFSEHGSRIFFGTAPKPAEEKKDDTPDNEKVSLDVWNWKDKKIMPQQLLQAAADAKRTYQAMVELSTGRVAQLETEEIPSISISQKGEGAFAIGSSDEKYRLESSWDEGYADYYLVDLKTLTSKQLFQRTESRPSFSPNGKYLAGFDYEAKQYFVIDPVSLKEHLTKIPTVLVNQLNDLPNTAPAYGEAGWTKDDARLLVYDEYDIWSIDPTGKAKDTCLTGGSGRMSNLRFRYLSADPESKFIDLGKPVLLSAFNADTKAAGFYTEDCNQPLPRPKKLLFDDKLYSSPILSKAGNVLTYTRQDYVEYPDVWVSKPDFSDAKKLSNANPQQANYNWGSAELVNWVSGDGQHLQGILLKPENFTYGKKYPMIAYFYERMSDTLHSYRTPAPSASTINLSYFPSNGYLVFIPDIPYKTGYPGESSVSAIVSGVLSIVNRGYVDTARLGIQGQSWGGYAVAYLVTRTNLFRCACSGAAVADMFSAYGGIRYGTGILREGQYEHGQSRIGGSIWDKPLRYLENSPLFWLDKVETPLLMMHNDKDGAVPFTQGIELFSGLRRLGKPAWMCVYNGEDHNLMERKNRKDWSVRLSQFFDHYLMDKPMPVWMSKGIPATQKGKTLGFDLDGSDPSPDRQ